MRIPRAGANIKKKLPRSSGVCRESNRQGNLKKKTRFHCCGDFISELTFWLGRRPTKTIHEASRWFKNFC